MNLQRSAPLEAKLTRLAADTGRTVDQVVLDLLASSVYHDEWFRREVEKGRRAAREGRLLDHGRCRRSQTPSVTTSPRPAPDFAHRVAKTIVEGIASRHTFPHRGRLGRVEALIEHGMTPDWEGEFADDVADYFATLRTEQSRG